MGRVFAATDIGSNTVHSLIAECAGLSVRRISNGNRWLSLGEVVSREGRVPEPLVDQLVTAIAGFKRVALKNGAESFYLFATEAIRKASNQQDIAKKILKKTGLVMNIVAPRLEAEFSCRGSMIDCPGPEPVTLIDVGGGSAQVAHVYDNTVHEEVSLPLGTGTLTAAAGLALPATPGQIERLEERIRDAIKQLDGFPDSMRIVASGGVARGVWKAMHPDGDRDIAEQEIRFLSWDSQRLTTNRIVARYGVEPRRAETFLPGSLVLLRLMERFRHDALTVSAYGVREGAIAALAEGRISGCAL